MAMLQTVPKEVLYSATQSVLVEGSSKRTTILTPLQGAGAISPGSIFSFDIPNQDFLDVNSMYLSFRLNVTTNATVGGADMCRVPFMTVISAMSVQANSGSTQLESINNYAHVTNLLFDLTADASQRYSQAYNYGLSNDSSGGWMEYTDGRNFPASATTSLGLAGPVVSSISNCIHNFPLFATGGLRFNFTMANLVDCFTATTAANVTAMTLDNIELHCDLVTYGPEVQNEIANQGKIYLKTQSYATNSQAVGVLGAGSYDFLINTRLTSARSVISWLTNGSTGNKIFDSTDWTSATASTPGYLSYYINGVSFPSKPMSTLNKSVVLLELKKCASDIFDMRNSAMSINNAEFSYLGTAASTTMAAPGKFYVGVNISKNSLGADNLLGGTSTNAAGIIFRLVTANATTAASSIISIVNYDGIFEIDPVLKTVYFKV